MSKLTLIPNKKCCFLLILLYTVGHCAPNFGPNMRRYFLADTNLQGTIKFLEREQSLLYKTINKLLSESIQELQVRILPEINPIIRKLNDFRDRLKKIHLNDVLNRYMNIEKGFNEEIEDLRRAMYRRNKRPSAAEDNMFDPDRIYDGMPLEKVEWRIKNKERIEGKFLSWLQEKKRKEKERYLHTLHNPKKTIRFERCPNFGFDGGKNGSVIKYPCCRKCCKKSDLGCL